MSTRFRLAATATLAAALAVTTLGATPASGAADADPLLVAHRGFSAAAPENTLPAVRRAVQAKADFVEIDVQRTKDRKLVLLHDADLRRTTDVEEVYPERATSPVSDFTWAELKRLDAGSWKGAAFDGTRVPTLDQAIRVLAGTRSKLLLELKDPSRFPGIERQVARVLDRFELIEPGTDDGVQVQSFDVGSVETFDELEPEAEVGVLVGAPPADPRTYRWAEAINPSYRTVTRAWVRRAQQAGFLTFVYTVNDPAEIRRMARYGVDGIITDDPDVAYLALR
ncbi:glycerophosphodiester phosphodiesterase [Solicola sp. PLA-1-18]|uniref:glycerophosphodiester phosphodiesterase n=1 Tax=Solicola sp. PLA-1-18 TaxID=3380532 RepID=UPI003B79F2B6